MSPTSYRTAPPRVTVPTGRYVSAAGGGGCHRCWGMSSSRGGARRRAELELGGPGAGRRSGGSGPVATWERRLGLAQAQLELGNPGVHFAQLELGEAAGEEALVGAFLDRYQVHQL